MQYSLPNVTQQHNVQSGGKLTSAYPTSPNKQKLLVRHILKSQIISLCYLGKFSVQNTQNRRDQNTSSGSFHQRMDTRYSQPLHCNDSSSSPLEKGCSELRGAAAKPLWHIIELLFNLYNSRVIYQPSKAFQISISFLKCPVATLFSCECLNIFMSSLNV